MPILILLLLGVILLGGYVALLVFLLYAIITFALGPLVVVAVMVAYAFAAITPLVLLVGRRWDVDRSKRLASPAEVVAGRVLGERPAGEMAAYGWDAAWPNYFPHQANRDFGFVARRMWGVCLRFFAMPWGWAARLWSGRGVIARLLWWLPVIVFMITAVGVPLMLFAVFAMTAAAVFIGVLWVVMTVAAEIARFVAFAYGWSERTGRRRASKELTCPSCYRTTLAPGYRCTGCARTHRLLQPGPLGILVRTCECGTRLPTTPTRAAGQRLEVVCPYCDAELGTTAGSRPTVLVPVIGSVGVGKTTFLASIVSGTAHVAGQSGAFAATNPAARQFVSLVDGGGTLPKTAFAGRPDVMVFEASTGGEMHDIQFVDAAGEFFVNWESGQALTYIDTATTWVFVIDPLMLPEVRDRLDVAGVVLGATSVGVGDAGDAYASVVDRFRAAGGATKSKSLAIVVSKADLLVQVPEWSGLGTSAQAVRALLLEHGADNLIRGAEFDFSDIGYFAVESRPGSRPDPVRDPVRVVDWVLGRKRLGLSFLGPMAMERAPSPAAIPVGTNTESVIE